MTKVITDDSEFVISENNCKQAIEMLKTYLAPGTPVLTSFCGQTNLGDNVLIISDGTLSVSDDQIGFGAQKGIHNAVYAYIGKTANPYDIVPQVKGYAPPAAAVKLFGGDVIIGKKVEEKYTDVLNAVKFASDAYYFKLPSFYSNYGHLVENYDVSDENRAKAETFFKLSTIMNLLREANEEDKFFAPVPVNDICARKLGPIRHEKDIRNSGYPADSQDFMIRESNHPSKLIGFVKTEVSFFRGDSFVLPAKGAEEFVGKALSEEFVKRYYPKQ